MIPIPPVMIRSCRYWNPRHSLRQNNRRFGRSEACPQDKHRQQPKQKP
jgi:hypothetical protein